MVRSEIHWFDYQLQQRLKSTKPIPTCPLDSSSTEMKEEIFVNMLFKISIFYKSTLGISINHLEKWGVAGGGSQMAILPGVTTQTVEIFFAVTHTYII